MRPQYVAPDSSYNVRVEAFESQFRRLQRDGYILHISSPIVRAGIPQEPLTSNTGAKAHSASKHLITSDRRPRCQRASNYWQHSALSLSLQLAPAMSQKNLSLLNRFRSSQHTQANTNNIPNGVLTLGWAPAPTPITSSYDEGVYAC